MFTNLFSLQYKEDHLVKFKTLSQLSPSYCMFLIITLEYFGKFQLLIKIRKIESKRGKTLCYRWGKNK